ncbi:MBL fold metallo-hydrolase [Tanticharoenia sakaeratensis]|uniref:Octanoyltransferase n=1 Tax=Tanticharoenia sakaeratensis NBRC 103193 TaxID=1231623 RepID=A0A0D6MMP3_9PROT|nr:MBL fold metallo-hydrolase [Tanticharoenia sakaeratensis]GAN54939.1 octanoyltransferase [Tanticharoenia sakaeratensis NBRC 103193]GBQ22529.1 metal-dependent hydrolase PhnP [Tanticharoenia sakaeratensis NBRC 103193]
MKITVLGCGGSSGVPMIGGADGHGYWGTCDPHEPRNRRTRSSILMTGDHGALLIDSGPDLRAQLLNCGIGRFDAVLYTHPHADHVAGLDELRSINRALGAALPLYATENTLGELRARFAYAFTPWKPPEFFRPVFTPHVIEPEERLRVAGMDLHLVPQVHGRIPTLGVRCGRFAYSTDVNLLHDDALASLEGLDTWMVDCFQNAPHSAHAWLDRVLHWRSILKPRRMILTHMGTDMDYRTLCDTLPQGVEPAWDGMEFDVI